MRKLLRSNCPIPPQQDLFQQGPEFNDTGKMKRKKRNALLQEPAEARIDEHILRHRSSN